MRLRLLALILALALFWYAMNPAPGSMRSAKKTEEPQDKESREAETPAATLLVTRRDGLTRGLARPCRLMS